MATYLFYFTLLLHSVSAQQQGAYTAEVHPKLPTQQCTKTGGCVTADTSVVLDSGWRWLHNVGGYNNCRGSSFDKKYCPDAASCGKNCAVEGANYANYGVTTSANSMTLSLYKNGNAQSPRVYLLQNETTYAQFKLLNREFTYDVDMSNVPCEVNGALYFSEMDPTGNAGANNAAGARYGTGYCDAQCPKSPFVAGLANIDGTKGACCNEMDIWEANSQATSMSPHPCLAQGIYTCTGASCSSTCDAWGCDNNPYRLGNRNFYGTGKTVDTTKPFTIVTQFITDSGQDGGNLKQIKRIYKQNGVVIPGPTTNVPGITTNTDGTTTDAFCSEEATAFKAGSGYTFPSRGAMKGMGDALGRGMTLVFSIWQDTYNGMAWLDGTTGDSSQPGNTHGPCPAYNGTAAAQKTAITFSNIKFGDIGSTF